MTKNLLLLKLLEIQLSLILSSLFVFIFKLLSVSILFNCSIIFSELFLIFCKYSFHHFPQLPNKKNPRSYTFKKLCGYWACVTFFLLFFLLLFFVCLLVYFFGALVYSDELMVKISITENQLLKRQEKQMWFFTYQFPPTKECICYGKVGACCSILKTLFCCIFKSRIVF